MPAFAMRFVGQENLPSRLSEFDREQFFELTSADVAAIEEHFRGAHRLSAGLMVLFMRASGRPLDGFEVLPRNLLKYAAQALGVAPPSIASLRSIYRRTQTLYKHQLWAKTYLDLRDLQPADEAELQSTLRTEAEACSHADDLFQSAGQWLFTRRILIPGARRLQDWARDAFATVEAQIFEVVNAAVPPANLQRLVESAYSIRPSSGTTHIEWLKTPSKRHGPSTLTEGLDKVRYLKSLGAQDWGPRQRRSGKATGLSPSSPVPTPCQEPRDQADSSDDRARVLSSGDAARAHRHRVAAVEQTESATHPPGC